jgi:hypothetical protein
MTNIRHLMAAAAGAAFLTIGAGAALAQANSGSASTQDAYQQGYDAGVSGQFHSNFYSGCENWCGSANSFNFTSGDSDLASSYGRGYQAGLRQENVSISP